MRTKLILFPGGHERTVILSRSTVAAVQHMHAMWRIGRVVDCSASSKRIIAALDTAGLIKVRSAWSEDFRVAGQGTATTIKCSLHGCQMQLTADGREAFNAIQRLDGHTADGCRPGAGRYVPTGGQQEYEASRPTCATCQDTGLIQVWYQPDNCPDCDAEVME